MTKRNSGFFDDRIIPIPLREDLVIRIFGLPIDLSQEEARKVAAVIMALASETQS